MLEISRQKKIQQIVLRNSNQRNSDKPSNAELYAMMREEEEEKEER